MKKNKLGFILTETLIVSTVVLTTLILIYIQFKKVDVNYETSFKYNTVDSLYNVNNIKIFFIKENYELVKTSINNGYVDITDCNLDYYIEKEYCKSLYSKLDVKMIIYASNDLKELKKYMIVNNLFSNDLREFINKIKSDEEFNHLIVEFNNNTYGHLLVR